MYLPIDLEGITSLPPGLSNSDVPRERNPGLLSRTSGASYLYHRAMRGPYPYRYTGNNDAGNIGVG